MAPKIQIVGAGLAGLALADELLREGFAVEIIEKKHIGAGASGIAAGLVHPYLGQSGKRALFADEALSYLQSKLDELQVDVSIPFSSEIEIQKFFFTSEDKAEFCTKMSSYGDFRELDEKSIIIRGLFIDTGQYLSHLAKSLEKRGATFLFEERNPDEIPLHPTVFCIGSSLAKSPSICFPSSVRKGQVFIAKKDPRVPRSLTCTAYLALDPFTDRMVLGSSYERDFRDELPDEETAYDSIYPRLSPYIPPWDELQILECRSGVRISPAVGYLPVFANKGDNRWIFGGFGSRGLLYHAFFAKKAAKCIMQELAAVYQSESLGCVR